METVSVLNGLIFIHFTHTSTVWQLLRLLELGHTHTMAQCLWMKLVQCYVDSSLLNSDNNKYDTIHSNMDI